MSDARYVVRLPMWDLGGHGSVFSVLRKGPTIESAQGHCLWQLRLRRRIWCWQSDVLNDQGRAVYLAATRKRILDIQGAHHEVWRDGELLGSSRMDRSWLSGTVVVGALHPVSYNSRHSGDTLRIGPKVVGYVHYGSWGTVEIEIVQTPYDVPEFLIAFAMLLEDFNSAGG